MCGESSEYGVPVQCSNSRSQSPSHSIRRSTADARNYAMECYKLMLWIKIDIENHISFEALVHSAASLCMCMYTVRTCMWQRADNRLVADVAMVKGCGGAECRRNCFAKIIAEPSFQWKLVIILFVNWKLFQMAEVEWCVKRTDRSARKFGKN